eukprot:m.413161 g.413161  ORF g.413161 m.413161 type:complete len:1647 (+) comp29029_c0_seq1:124-5064(+)
MGAHQITVTAVVLALAQLVSAQSAIQGTLDTYCRSTRVGDDAYLARYIALSNVAGSPKAWHCVLGAFSVRNNYSPTTPGRGCVAQSGQCELCDGTVVGTALIVLPEQMTAGEQNAFNGVLGTTTGNRTADLLNRVNAFSQGGQWFCPDVTPIAWSQSTPVSITVKQLSIVEWTWADLRNVQQGVLGSSPSQSAFTSGAVSIGGSYNRTFTTVGTVNYHSLADTSSPNRVLVVTDADECIGEGSPMCLSSRMCNNVEGSYYCLALCGSNGSATCGAADQSCNTYDGTQACGCDAGYTGQDVCADVDECAINIDTCNDGQHTCANTAGSFACNCNLGYSASGAACTNVDECTASTDNCHADATCTDTTGSFTCACGTGYTGDGLSCADSNECAAATGPCDANATCGNIAGSFVCNCNAGFTGSGLLCANFDECATSGDNCHGNATCTDLPGSFTCACDTGFVGDGVTCADIDECFASIDNCNANGACNNTLGSFVCTCNTGFSGSGVTCADNDECTANTDTCSTIQVCQNTMGSFACGAINECSDGSHNCSTDATCTDTASGFGFSCACNAGYTGPGNTCADVDECLSLPCTDTCTNSAGAFSCSCNNTGRELVGGPTGVACVEINECARGTHNCDASAACADVAGSFQCTCNTGFAGTGIACSNIDECTVNTDNCDAQATCTNSAGSFTCACDAGWTGNGTSCANIDECTVSALNVCGGNATCADSAGSYTCSCNNGFGQTLPEQGRTDIFQCTNLTGCGSNPCLNGGVCASATGGFSCSCDGTGYMGTRCEVNRNECTSSSPNDDDCNADATCVDSMGSFSCACNAGYSGTGTACSTVDECTLDTDNCDVLASCTDTLGSFTCACNASTHSGDGITCALRTLGYGIELVTQRNDFVGRSIPFRIVARDAFGQILPTEQADVFITINTSRVYRPVSAPGFFVDVVNGQGLGQFTATTAGIYVIGMQLGSNPNNLDVSQTQELWFATNSSFRIEPHTGAAQVKAANRFTNVASANINDLWMVDFASRFAEFLLPNEHYRGSFGTTGISTANTYGALKTTGKLTWIELDRAAQTFTFSVGITFDNSASGATEVNNSKQFYAHLHSQSCSAGSGGLAVNPNRQNQDPANEAHVLLTCAASGSCLGSAEVQWIPSDSMTTRSVVIVDSTARDAVGPKVFCADLVAVNKAELLTLDSVEAGGVQFNYLASDIAAPTRRGRRQSAANQLFVTYTVDVPVIGAATTAAYIHSTSSPALITKLSESVRLAPSLTTTVASVVTLPQVSIADVDCSLDSWSTFSPCLTASSTVPECPVGSSGINSRFRQCPVESTTQPGVYITSEARTCIAVGPCAAAPACGDASNGGCDAIARATCTTVGGAPTCACNSNFVGNGTTCIVAETDTADVTLRFTAPLLLVAPTQTQQRSLLSAITARANIVMGLVSSSRNFAAQIVSTQTTFTVTYTILPRTADDTVVSCTAATALVSAQLSQLAVSFGSTLLTPSFKTAVCPGPLPSFTTTTSTGTTGTTTTTATTATATSTTFYNSSANSSANNNLAVQSASDDKWGDEYTLFLVGALLVVFGVLMAVGLVCAVRENSKRKMLELGLLVNPHASPFAANNGQQFTMKAEAGPGEEQKWLNDDTSHFYPPPGQGTR